MNGAIFSIAVDPTDANIVYVGSSGGGVWKTTDGGVNWKPLLDHLWPMNVMAIAVDPSKPLTVYAGTSAAQFGTSSNNVLKSYDGGQSWVVLGSGFPDGNSGNAFNAFAGYAIRGITVDPSDSRVVNIAADGGAGHGGLYRSTDGGLNWTKTYTGMARHLLLDPTSPSGSRVLFASIYTTGILKSVNGGQSWSTVLDKNTPAVSALLTGNRTTAWSVPALAPPISPPNAGGVLVLYASVNLTDSRGMELFESTDQGAHWTWRAAQGLDNVAGPGSSGDSPEMMVDPASPGDGLHDVLYWGGVAEYRSSDSAQSFADISGQCKHSDVRAWAGLAKTDGTSVVYMGNDGGFFRSTDRAATDFTPLNSGGLQTAMFYNFDLKYDSTASMSIGSLQDFGPAISLDTSQWALTAYGDGWDSIFDRITQDTAYCTYYCNVNGTSCLNRALDSGNTWEDYSSNIPSSDIPWDEAYSNPIAVDPNTAGKLYFCGAQSVWQRQSDGTYRNWPFGDSTGSVTISERNSGWVAFTVGGTHVFLTLDALNSNPTFYEQTLNLPTRQISRLAFDPNDATILYATLRGFNSDTPGHPGHVFRLTLFTGGNWTDISPSVDIPVNAIALDGAANPTIMYLGSGLGILQSTDGGTTWGKVDEIHFPNVAVAGVAINSQAGVLRAGTYGRGVFELASPTGPVISVAADNGLDFSTTCVGRNNKLTIHVYNVGTAPLLISGVQRLMGSSAFYPVAPPTAPLTINPNSSADFAIAYEPTFNHTLEKAVIRIASNDPGAPYVDLVASGTANILYVSSQYPTVASAYANAADCSIIRISTGIYHEAPISFAGRKHVRLESQGGSASITK
jgi:photosystem II stability/assembly factor-like uncharacterized protein